MKVAPVVNVRPNFVKLIPVHKTISAVVDHTIIHTGQHYDYEMSEIFFKEFNLPKMSFGDSKTLTMINELIKLLDDGDKG